MLETGAMCALTRLREGIGGSTFFNQLLEENFRKACLNIGKLNGHFHKLAIFIKVNQDVSINIFRLRHFLITEFDIGGVRVRKIFDLHLVSERIDQKMGGE